MRPIDRIVALLAVANACSRPPPLAGEVASPAQASPDAGAGDEASGAGPVMAEAKGEPPLGPEEGLTPVEPLRPGADEVDRGLMLRLRRHANAALTVEAVVRFEDAWLVAYTYDELDAWWREVHRAGEADEVRAELRRRRLACEAAARLPGGEAATEGAQVEAIDGFDPEPANGMDERSCWERAVASLAPREGPIEGDCQALAVVRVTDAAIEPLWSFTGDCVAPPEVELVDVAGAGWPQLVLKVRAEHWDVTRLGFQEAYTTARVVILDPRKADGAEMLEQRLSYETHVDHMWHWEGSYAHVSIAPGRHLTVIEQEWRTSEACEVDAAGWAVAAPPDDGLEPCSVEWKVHRTAWDPARQRWSGKAERLPVPKRLPLRDGELQVVGAGRRAPKGG